MKVQKITISNFKRFTNLTVHQIPETARLIILVGPNGCGKSSFFDAFRFWCDFSRDDIYYIKQGAAISMDDLYHSAVQIEFHNKLSPGPGVRSGIFQCRSAHRNEPEFQLSQLNRVADSDNRISGVMRMIDNDAVVSKNYQRLVSQALASMFADSEQEIKLSDLREQIIGEIRDALLQIFEDVRLDDLSDPLQDGTFRFTKGGSKGFHYKNLSSGEKSAFDLILDLCVRKRNNNEAIVCIDEPETHTNAKVQARLLSALYNLIPENGQLILATHAAGIMRGAQEIEQRNPGSVVFLDFWNRDFDQPQVIKPVTPNREFWKTAYEVAFDDLAALLAPERVIICEGVPQGGNSSGNYDHDARCYDTIFKDEYPQTEFISGGGSSEVIKNRLMLKNLIKGVDVMRLIDRDDRSDAEIEDARRDGVKILSRRNLESYLFSNEILTVLADQKGKPGDAATILSEKESLITECQGAVDDFKPIAGKIYLFCKKHLQLTQCGNDTRAFMRDTLAPLVKPGTETYKKLRTDIFGF